MRNRERSAWSEVCAPLVMRDKHEVRMSDMRPVGVCRRLVVKIDVRLAGADDEKSRSNLDFLRGPSRAAREL
jgi:hypothetical protein